MVKAMWNNNNLTRGAAFLGKYSNKRCTVKQAVHDGDTVLVELDGNLSIRFLGIDTPEISFQYPGTTVFKNIFPHFQNYLTDPFGKQWKDSIAYKTKLGVGLSQYLSNKLDSHCAGTHFQYANEAQRKLEEFIQRDENTFISGNTTDSNATLRFFLAFAYEIMDRYGRMLCYLHQDLPVSQRQGHLSYNEEMLQSGFAEAYFIFPNIDPFRAAKGIVDAIPNAAKFKQYIQKEKRLQNARDFVKDARKNSIGIFNTSKPLGLEPFELRYLARREVPSRWVIDLETCKPILIKPTDYYLIPKSENRLFINREHLCLFKEKGYEIKV